MPQIVSGQSGYLGGETGGTGNGVGAVIFDKPDDSGAQMMFNAIQNNTQYLRQQEAAKQKEQKEKELAALDGINLDVKGVFDVDIPYFQEKTKDIVNKYGDILGKYKGDLASVGAMQDLNQLEKEKANLKLEAEASKNHKQVYDNFNKVYTAKPDEFDLDATEKTKQDYANAPITERSKYNLGIPYIKDFATESMPFLSKIKPVTTQVQTNEKLPNGQYKLVEKTAYTPQQINQSAKTLVTDDRTFKSASKSFGNLPAIEKSVYQMKANSENERQKAQNPNAPEISPLEMFARDHVANVLSLENEKVKNLPENEWEKQSAKTWGYGQRAGVDAKYDTFLYDQSNNFLKGATGQIENVEEIKAPFVMNANTGIPAIDQYTYTKRYDVPMLEGVTINEQIVTKPMLNPSTGEIIQGEYIQDKKPEKIIKASHFETIDANGNPITVPMIVTTKTLTDKGINPETFTDFNRSDVWRPYTQGDVQTTTLVNKLKVPQAHIYKEAGGYKGKIPETEKIVTQERLPQKKGAPNVTIENTKGATQAPTKGNETPKAKTQADWNAAWAKLPKGGTMVGLDGKTYKKP